MIILWWDESESDGVAGDNGDDFNHTIGEIIISPLAHRNESGVPYSNAINYSHSSDLRTMQEIFHVKATGRVTLSGRCSQCDRFVRPVRARRDPDAPIGPIEQLPTQRRRDRPCDDLCVFFWPALAGCLR